MRRELRRILHAVGAVVDTAATEREALSRISQRAYAVVVAECKDDCVPADLVTQVQGLGSLATFVLLRGPTMVDVSTDGESSVLGFVSLPLHPPELVQLVRHAAAVARQRRPPSIAPGAPSQLAGSALVVDDNPGDRELIRLCLETMQHDTTAMITAATAQQAFDLVRERHFGFAVVDLQLPDSAGLDVVRHLYASDPNLAIIVASDLAPDLAQQALACGAQEVVMKQDLMRELPAAVGRALLRKSADRDVRYRASHDPLTGLLNRARFAEAVERAIARLRRSAGLSAVIYIDLDGFKPINDRHGHAAGDTVLKEVAQRLREALRDTDAAGRLGGDEFAVLLDDVADMAAVRGVAHGLLRALIQPISLHGRHDVCVNASLGVALCSADSSVLGVMDAADAAMYNAKDAGGGQYLFADQPSTPEEDSARRVMLDLREALDRSDFHLVFQHQVDLRTHSIVGMEALLRWRRGGRVVAPDEFIPMLEQTGLIVDVGAWVLREACKSTALWSSRHDRRIRVAVNVSPRQLEQENFASYVQQVINDCGLAPGLLELEITEGTLLRNTNTITQTLTTLRKMGVRLMIDDFGTGYASLSYLRRYPVDGLKIDRSFVQSIASENTSRVLVGTMIDLAHQLNMEVVAEGVEALSQVRYLRDRGCDTCQGFLFGRPHYLGDSQPRISSLPPATPSIMVPRLASSG